VAHIFEKKGHGLLSPSGAQLATGEGNLAGCPGTPFGVVVPGQPATSGLQSCECTQETQFLGLAPFSGYLVQIGIHRVTDRKSHRRSEESRRND